jgi:lipoprotein-anchoring transpeptidase ErfK/SrfK
MRRRMSLPQMSLPLFALALAAGLATVACGPAQSAAAGPGSAASPVANASQASPSARSHSSSSAVAASAASAQTPPTLTLGSHGQYVKQLQSRLSALRYYPGTVDGQFGPDTQEAVWAFQEVQRLPATGDVGPLTWTRLGHPWNPVQLVPSGGSMRVEVFLGRHFLVLYVNSQVRLISHVSTGGGYYYCSPGGGCGYAITPTGNYKTTVFMPGWVTVPLGKMYNPVFFIATAFAIHGDTDVPLEPVSHGCVRIPMDIAAFFHTLVKTPGTPVYIRKA